MGTEMCYEHLHTDHQGQDSQVESQAGALDDALRKLATRPQTGDVPISGNALQSNHPQAQHESELPLAADRREFPRRISACRIAVCRIDNADAFTPRTAWMLHSTKLKGNLVDISMNGVRFSLSEQFQPDEQLALRITNQHFDNIDAVGTVVRSEQGENGRWFVVCAFQSKLTFDQMRHFGQQMFHSEFV